MAAVKSRCFLATNGNTLNYLTMTSHYDTPRAFDKNRLVCHSIVLRLSKGQAGVTNWSAYAKTSDKVHASKVKHTNKAMRTQRKTPSSATFNVQTLNKSTAKITLYNMSNNKV